MLTEKIILTAPKPGEYVCDNRLATQKNKNKWSAFSWRFSSLTTAQSAVQYIHPFTHTFMMTAAVMQGANYLSGPITRRPALPTEPQ